LSFAWLLFVWNGSSGFCELLLLSLWGGRGRVGFGCGGGGGGVVGGQAFGAMATELGSGPRSWIDSYKGMSSDNIKGLVLALSSSIFIGASFIVKKKGLKKAGASGVRAGLDVLFDFEFSWAFISIFCLGTMCLMRASSSKIRWGLIVLIVTSLKPVERIWVDLDFPISYWVYVYCEFGCNALLQHLRE
jgi:hypothetical protein